MDPVSAIGLAGSVIGIIDVAAKSISSLRKLQERWKAADLTISLLVGQLTTLKAALEQISAWISRSLDGNEQHHQLVLSFETTMQSCKLLLHVLDGQLSELEWDASHKLDFESRVKAVLEDCTLKEYANHLSHQYVAMNLLLTALNCQTMAEQKEILESDRSRKIINQIKDDTSSLFCLRDSMSFRTSFTSPTERFSMLSREFDFDAELVQSKVYNKQMKSFMRRAIRDSRRAITGAAGLHAVGDPRTDSIFTKVDKSMVLGGRMRRRCVRLLILGQSESEKTMFMDMMRAASGERQTPNHCEVTKGNIISMIYDTGLDMLEECGAECWTSPESNYIDTIESQARNGDCRIMSYEVAYAIDSLWKNPAMKKYWRRAIGWQRREALIYFLRSIYRVARPDYLPNDYDLAKLRADSKKLEELVFRFSPEQEPFYHVVKPGMANQELKKLASVFADTDIIIFPVDLSSYDDTLEDNLEENRLSESISLFERICHSKWLGNKSVLVIFTNLKILREKLTEQPLQLHFPDYEGGLDVDAAQSYISERFSLIRKAPDPFPVHYAYLDNYDVHMVRKIMTDINSMMIAGNARDVGLG